MLLASCSGGNSSHQGPSDSQLDALSVMMNTARDSGRNEDYQAAIDFAVSISGSDTSNLAGITFNESYSGQGGANQDGFVEIGTGAFREDFGNTSPGFLVMTIKHEIDIHLNEQLMGGRWYLNDSGLLLMEIEATDYSISIANDLQLTETEIDWLLDHRTTLEYAEDWVDYLQFAINNGYVLPIDPKTGLPYIPGDDPFDVAPIPD